MLRKKKEVSRKEGRGAGKDFAGNPGCRPEVGALLTQGVTHTTTSTELGRGLRNLH